MSKVVQLLQEDKLSHTDVVDYMVGMNRDVKPRKLEVDERDMKYIRDQFLRLIDLQENIRHQWWRVRDDKKLKQTTKSIGLGFEMTTEEWMGVVEENMRRVRIDTLKVLNNYFYQGEVVIPDRNDYKEDWFDDCNVCGETPNNDHLEFIPPDPDEDV